MIGSIIGVGVFGLPYAFAQSGYLLGLLVLFFVAIILTLLQLMYAEVAVQTPGKHRLIGYVRKYMGEGWSWAAMIALSASLWGAMIAYIIIGGEFVYALVSPLTGGSVVVFSFFVALLSSVLMFKGLKFVSKIDMVLVVVLLFVFLFIFLASLPHIELKNLTYVNLDKIFIPYGVALFSLSGIGAVPEIKELLGRRKNLLPYAVVVGLLVIITIYVSFSFAVIGVTGTATTQAAFEGLIPVLGPTFRIVASLLGALTVISIFTVLGVIMIDTFENDFGVPHFPAWILVSGVPIVLFLLGLREFIETVSFVGTVFSGFLGIIIVLMFERMRKTPICKTHHCLDMPRAVSWVIIAVFMGGIIWEIISSLM